MKKTVIAIGITSLAGILLFMFSVHTMTSDSLSYIRVARDSDTQHLLFHPHHLFYIPTLKLLFLLFSKIYAGIIAKMLGGVAAVACILGMYQIFAKIFSDLWIPAIWAFCLLICSGFWLFAVQEVYVPSMAFLVVLTWLMIEIFEKQSVSTLDAVKLAGILIGAVGFHQTNVLISVPMIFVLYSLPLSLNDKLKKGLIIFGSSGILTLLMYIIAARIKMGAWGLEAFSQFCFEYHNRGVQGWGELQNVSLPNLFKLMGRQYQNIFELPEDIYEKFGFRTFVLTCLMFFWQHKQIQKKADFAQLRYFCLLWLGIYYAFFLWWLPGEREFTIVTLIPLLILLALFAKDLCDLLQKKYLTFSKITLYLLSSALIVGILQANLSYIQTWHTKISYQEETAKEFLSNGKPPCNIYIDDFGTFEYLCYLNNEQVSARAAYFMLDYAYKGNPNDNSGNYAFPRNECTWFLPGLTEPNQALYGTYNAFAQPKGWLRTLSLTFHLDFDENKQIKESNHYVFKQVGKFNIIETSPQRVKYENSAHFMQVLDSTRCAFIKDKSLFYSDFYQKYEKELLAD